MRTLRILRIALPCLSIGLLVTAVVFHVWREGLGHDLYAIRQEAEITRRYEQNPYLQALDGYDPSIAAVSNEQRWIKAARIEKQIEIAQAGVVLPKLAATVCGLLWFLLMVPIVWGFLARGYRPTAVGIVKAARTGWRGSIQHVLGIVDEAKRGERR